jgi:hypothetical protein
VEVQHAVSAVVGRQHPIGPGLFGPAAAAGGPDSQWAELIEREDAIREAVQDVLDAVELGVALGVRGFFPGLGCAGR